MTGKTLFFGLLGLTMTGCVVFAPPSPMVTYGGPETTKKGTSETVIALGTGNADFLGSHSSGTGWFGRYKYGLSNKFDIGIDAIGFKYSDKSTLTAKIAARYQLQPHFRLEAGIGGADDTKGKSLNCDLGLTGGTIPKDKNWNLYYTLRFGYANGFPGNVFTFDGSSEDDTVAPLNNCLALLNIGTQGKVSDNIKFIWEAGYGYLFPEGKGTTRIVYLSCGLLFNIGSIKNK